MARRLAIACCLCFLAAAASAAEGTPRTWTTADGKRTVEAVFVEMQDELVVLKTDAGKTLKISVSKLSPLDQKYLRLRGALPKAEKPAATEPSGKPAKSKPGRPAPEKTPPVEPTTEPTPEPAGEVTAKPAAEVTAKPAGDVTAKPAGNVTAESAAEPPPRPGVKLTPASDEAQQFARELEAALTAGDKAAIEKLIDYAALFDRAVRLKNPPQVLKTQLDLFRELSTSANDTAGISFLLLEGMDPGNRWQVVHARTAGQPPQERVLVRIIAGGRLVYYDLILGRDKNRRLKVVDMHALLHGHLESESLRRSFMEIVGPHNRAWASSIVGLDPLWLANLDGLLALDKADDDGQFKAALDEYERLPEALRRQPILLDDALVHARLSSEERYPKLIDLACEVAKTEPILRMRVLNVLLDREPDERTFEMLTLVDEAIGGDAYLDVLRADLFESQGKPAEAQKAVAAALGRDPGLVEAYEWQLGRLLQKRRRETAPQKAQRLEQAAAVWQQLEANAPGSRRLEAFRQENKELGDQLKQAPR